MKRENLSRYVPSDRTLEVTVQFRRIAITAQQLCSIDADEV
jgi:hypothetical protein